MGGRPLPRDTPLLLATQKKDAEVEPICERSHAIREKVLGPEHPDMAASLDLQAKVLLSQVRVCGILVEVHWGPHISVDRF